jgi:ABC-type lipoprotein release transport system permease subunit
MIGGGSKRLWTKDTIAGVILGCVACIFVQTQLQTWADRLNSPAINAALRWWPALLVVAGAALLLRRKSGLDSAREGASRPEEVANERRQSRNG